ncbi:hypothetical protein RchiOBHm_Chr1g0328881 [Rosa chinensis]|uniref:Uncharacterized protein n=1 Tax=Rosa chinensis TaxID=74649 RepID=A0A2P6SAY7_ROSCH|nr:hypothetical protein RchiOBHm_Chr1g0328881 [Rosa chinensis]
MFHNYALPSPIPYSSKYNISICLLPTFWISLHFYHMSSSYKAAQSVAGFFGKRQQTQFLHCFRFAITISCVIHQIEFGFLSITLSRQDYQESMQRSIWIVLLPLFLVLLLGVSLVSYCYSGM